MLRKFFHLLNKDLEEGNKIANQGLSNLKNKKVITIGDKTLKIDRKIAEGGFADIFRVNDQAKFSDSMPYALKRMWVAKPERKKGNLLEDASEVDSVRTAFNQEVKILKKFPDCPNLVKMAAFQEFEKRDGSEVFILLEYCPHSTLFQLIEEHCKAGLKGITNEKDLYKIINDIANGLRVLHSKNVSHRDIKIENVLKGTDQNWKICDFGSCTDQQIVARGQDLDEAFIEISKMTTMIYRAPEQLDQYKGCDISTKVDIWALGCVMFTLMFQRPPFEDGMKLAQINGKYNLPAQPSYSPACISLVKKMLQVDPNNRPTA